MVLFLPNSSRSSQALSNLFGERAIGTRVQAEIDRCLMIVGPRGRRCSTRIAAFGRQIALGPRLSPADLVPPLRCHPDVLQVMAEELAGIEV